MNKKQREIKKLIKDLPEHKELLKAEEGEVVSGNGYIPFIVKKYGRGRRHIDIRNYLDRIRPFMLKGQNLKDACRNANVPYETLSKYKQKNPAIADEIEGYENYISNVAEGNVADDIIDGNVENSKWYLERVKKGKYGSNKNDPLTGSGSIEIKWEIDDKK